MATGNIYTKLREIAYGHVVFEMCEWTDRQAGRHTDTLTAILCTPTGGIVRCRS